MTIESDPENIEFDPDKDAVDPDKDAVDRDKHGVSLAFGARVFAGAGVIVVATTRVEGGEQRFRAIGLVDGRLWTAVHVCRGQVVRMTSVRKSNDSENGLMIALEADPDDPEDGDVTVEAVERALEDRRRRLRGLQKAPTKNQVTLRVDADVLARYRATGPGWQTRMNDALRAAAPAPAPAFAPAPAPAFAA